MGLGGVRSRAENVVYEVLKKKKRKKEKGEVEPEKGT